MGKPTLFKMSSKCGIRCNSGPDHSIDNQVLNFVGNVVWFGEITLPFLVSQWEKFLKSHELSSQPHPRAFMLAAVARTGT